MTKRITQAEIAEQAGVSQSTVSQILSGRHKTIILPETCARVLQVAETLGYHPRTSLPARKAQTRTIAFLTPERRTHEVLNIYIRRLYTGVLQQLDAQNFHLIQAILHTDELVPEVVRKGMVDGVVIEDECDSAQIRHTQQLVPVVLLNHHVDDVPVDSCMPDNQGGLWQAVHHLVEQGHRRIALFGFDPHTVNHAERLAGYYRAMEACGLPVNADDVVLGTTTRAFDSTDAENLAYATLQRWWGAPTQPTAVVALCDANASAMLRAAQLLGIAVPEQLSLIGFDNAAFCEHTMPRLTSIHQPMEDMGKLACRLLLERIAGDRRPVQHIQLGVDLIIRETVAPPCLPAAAEVVHC